MKSQGSPAFPPVHLAPVEYVKYRRRPSVVSVPSDRAPDLFGICSLPSPSPTPPIRTPSDSRSSAPLVVAPVPQAPISSTVLHSLDAALERSVPSTPPQASVTAQTGSSQPTDSVYNDFDSLLSGTSRTSVSAPPSLGRARDRSPCTSRPHHSESLEAGSPGDHPKPSKSKARQSVNVSSPVPQQSFSLLPIELYPGLLAPVFPDIIDLVWNISLPETTARLRDKYARLSQPISEPILALPATRPRVRRMALCLQSFEDIPDKWRHVEVRSSQSSPDDFVTVGAVLHAIYRALRQPITRQEYMRIAVCGRQQQILQAYEQRCRQAKHDREAERLRGVKRIDCFEAVGFGGLERPPKGEGDVWRVILREM